MYSKIIYTTAYCAGTGQRYIGAALVPTRTGPPFEGLCFETSRIFENTEVFFWCDLALYLNLKNIQLSRLWIDCKVVQVKPQEKEKLIAAC